jgi:hypothetical protein
MLAPLNPAGPDNSELSIGAPYELICGPLDCRVRERRGEHNRRSLRRLILRRRLKSM